MVKLLRYRECKLTGIANRKMKDFLFFDFHEKKNDHQYIHIHNLEFCFWFNQVTCFRSQILKTQIRYFIFLQQATCEQRWILNSKNQLSVNRLPETLMLQLEKYETCNWRRRFCVTFENATSQVLCSIFLEKKRKTGGKQPLAGQLWNEIFILGNWSHHQRTIL